MNRSAIVLFEFNSMLNRFDRNKAAILHALKLYEYVNKLVAVRGIFLISSVLPFNQYLNPRINSLLRGIDQLVHLGASVGGSKP